MDDEIRPLSDEQRAWLDQAEHYALRLLRGRFGDVTLIDS
jgi:hypothetical protein